MLETLLRLLETMDLYLHPKWQKTIAGDLKRTFPNCQFIVTTHSPFIIQSLNKEKVINIEKEHIYEIGSFSAKILDDMEFKTLKSLCEEKDKWNTRLQKIKNELIILALPIE